MNHIIAMILFILGFMNFYYGLDWFNPEVDFQLVHFIDLLSGCILYSTSGKYSAMAMKDK